MSYTTEIEGSIAGATMMVESQSGLSKKSLVNEDLTENPSTAELFSYAVCCAGQGLLWAMYLVLMVTVPAVISQGIPFLP